MDGQIDVVCFLCSYFVLFAGSGSGLLFLVHVSIHEFVHIYAHTHIYIIPQVKQKRTKSLWVFLKKNRFFLTLWDSLQRGCLPSSTATVSEK